MVMKRLFMAVKAKLFPFLWGSFILLVSQIITIHAAFREKNFIEANQIVAPQVSLEMPLIYFFGAVVLMGVILFLLPVSKLRIV